MYKPLSVKINPCKMDNKESKESRLAVWEAFESGKIKVNKCDLDNIMEIDYVRTNKAGQIQKSASDNAIVLGRLKGLSEHFKECISLKIGFEQVRPEIDNSFLVEEYIYRFTNKLVEYDFTPHVIVMYASYICKNFLENTINALPLAHQRDFLKDIVAEMNNINDSKKIYDMKNAKILMLERSQGSILRNSLNIKHEKIQKKIIFQLLYTLHIFNQFDLRHNDIHAGNVFIETLTKPAKMCYVIGKDKYYLNTLFFVKIYDFDLSTIVGRTQNTRIDQFCKKYGACNVKNPKYDAYYILSELELHDFAPEFIRKHINIDVLSEKNSMNGRLLGTNGGNYCPDDKLMSSVEQMLKDPWFDEFKTPIPVSQTFADRGTNPNSKMFD